MTKAKLFLGAFTAIITSFGLFAYNADKRSGAQRLFTTSAANGCRLAHCWTLNGGSQFTPFTADTYYTQKTVGGKCKTVYTSAKTATM